MSLPQAAPFRVTVRRSLAGVVIGVEDAAPGSAQAHHALPNDLGGRGLDIVQGVAHRWGCDSLDQGKVVWAEFASVDADEGTSTREHAPPSLAPTSRVPRPA